MIWLDSVYANNYSNLINLTLQTTNQNQTISSIVVEAHPNQREIFYNDTRNKVIVTGRRWGKSILGVEEALKTAKQIPNSLVWIVAPTREMVKDIHWDYLKRRVKELNWRVKVNESNLTITRLLNGSKISLKTADNPDRLRGRGLDKVIIDEFRDMEQSVWQEILRPALSDKLGKAVFASTTNGYDVLYDLYQLGQSGDPDWKSWHYKTIDSPFIADSEIEQARKDLDAKTFRQEYEASFETASGRVYYGFDRNFNVRHKDYEPLLPLILTLDFNVNPCKWGFIQQYLEGDYVIDELIKNDTYTEEMAKAVKQRYPDARFIVYGDYTGNSPRSTQSRVTDYEIIKNILNLRTDQIRIKPNPAIVDRVNSLNARLCNALGQRRFFVSPNCKHSINSLEKVLYDPKKRQPDKSTTEKNAETALTDGFGYMTEYEYSLKGKNEYSKAPL